MRLFVQIVLVIVGSSLGGLARWGVGSTTVRVFGAGYAHYGTFIINITGSLFLGWFLTLLAGRAPESGAGWLRDDQLRLLLAVGFAGAYTTFSTFEWEAHGLLRERDWWSGTIYVLGSVLVGLLALRVGVWLARAA